MSVALAVPLETLIMIFAALVAGLGAGVLWRYSWGAKS